MKMCKIKTFFKIATKGIMFSPNALRIAFIVSIIHFHVVRRPLSS